MAGRGLSKGSLTWISRLAGWLAGRLPAEFLSLAKLCPSQLIRTVSQNANKDTQKEMKSGKELNAKFNYSAVSCFPNLISVSNEGLSKLLEGTLKIHTVQCLSDFPDISLGMRSCWHKHII